MIKVAMLALVAAAAAAQTAPVVLTWDPYPIVGATINVYRSSATCAATTFAAANKIGSVAGTVTTYSDATAIVPGPYCYALSATVGRRESPLSRGVDITIPSSPTGLLVALAGRGPMTLGWLYSDGCHPWPSGFHLSSTAPPVVDPACRATCAAGDRACMDAAWAACSRPIVGASWISNAPEGSCVL